jgi:hypothetical protein
LNGKIIVDGKEQDAPESREQLPENVVIPKDGSLTITASIQVKG